MRLVTFSRWVARGALVSLLVLAVVGAVFLRHTNQMHETLGRLVQLQADGQDLVDGATAIAQFGTDKDLLAFYERDAREVQQTMRDLGRDFPSALAAAQTVDLLLRDARLLAHASGSMTGPDAAPGIVPSADLAERLQLTIVGHGIAMRAALVEAITGAQASLSKVELASDGLLVVIAALLLMAVVSAAVMVDRRVGVPLQGLLEAIRAIGSGSRVEAPDPGRRDEVGEVIAAFNDLVREGAFLEGEIDRHQQTLAMAGAVARFGGWSYDAVSGYIEWSDETALTFDEAPGFEPGFQQMLDYFEPGDRQRLVDLVDACLSAGTPYDEVFRVRTARGRLIWARSVGHPLRDETGAITGAYGAFQDVTELYESRVSAERQAKIAAEAQKHESLGKLTGGIAHDFNNLLAVIMANLELLRENEADADRSGMLDSALHATQRGADLTRNMLAFARRAPLEPQVLDLNEVVRTTKQLAARTLPSSVDIDTSLLAGLWKIRADRASTESALLNLIVNANDAMKGTGRLTIETSNLRVEEDYIQSRNEDIPVGRYVMLGVSDTGTGIPSEIVERIFEPFFTTKGPEAGSGLGLSMVQGFLRQSGGTIRVYSEPGIGTTFKLFFPALHEADDPVQEPAEQLAAASGEGRRVLLVEDEADVLGALGRILEQAGYEVVPASSGDRALDLFRADDRFDLVVTDIVMPGALQGPGLVHALRDLSPDLPAVFMSGYAAEATVHGNGLRPSDIRLMKPVQRSQFLAALTRALAGAEPPPA